LITEAAMNKTTLAILASAMVSVACGGMGGHHRDMHSRHHGAGHGGMMTSMDANSDGMLSKDEFMKAHEAMFDRMKGPNGMISLKDMQRPGQGMK
jgi:hypothetical protein